jgi:hypothetical protein
MRGGFGKTVTVYRAGEPEPFPFRLKRNGALFLYFDVFSLR